MGGRRLGPLAWHLWACLTKTSQTSGSPSWSQVWPRSLLPSGKTLIICWGGMQVVMEAAERRVEADMRRQHGQVRTAKVELQRGQAATSTMILALAAVEVRGWNACLCSAGLQLRVFVYLLMGSPEFGRRPQLACCLACSRVTVMAPTTRMILTSLACR